MLIFFLLIPYLIILSLCHFFLTSYIFVFPVFLIKILLHFLCFYHTSLQQNVHPYQEFTIELESKYFSAPKTLRIPLPTKQPGKYFHFGVSELKWNLIVEWFHFGFTKFCQWLDFFQVYMWRGNVQNIIVFYASLKVVCNVGQGDIESDLESGTEWHKTKVSVNFCLK